MKSYAILFALETLMGPDNEPNAEACTVYSMLTMQAQLTGHAIQDGKLDDPIPYVEIFCDRPESDREMLMAWFEFNDIMKPRALRLGLDEIGKDKILAVFDCIPQRIQMWRGAGAVCFQLQAKKEIVLAS